MCVLTKGQWASEQTWNRPQAQVIEPELQAEPALSLSYDTRATGLPLGSSHLGNQGDPPGQALSVYFPLVAAWPSLTICLAAELGPWSRSFSPVSLTPSSMTCSGSGPVFWEKH